MASRIVRDELGSVHLKTLEKICLALDCTPNDLLEWYPSESYHDTERYALYAIKAKDPVHAAKISKLLHELSLGTLEKLESLITDKKGPEKTGE